MNKYIWKKIDPSRYFSDIHIPDDWNTLEEFVDWYLDSRMPLMIPYNAEVIRSDDACAVCIFKKGHYQVEFYLEYPEMWIRKHSHPRMDVIVMQLGGGSVAPKDTHGVSKTWGVLNTNLKAGEYHGGDSSSITSNGFITLAFQRWERVDEMTSAAIQWNGELQGPIQQNLIRQSKPDAYIVEGYANVAKTKE